MEYIFIFYGIFLTLMTFLVFLVVLILLLIGTYNILRYLSRVRELLYLEGLSATILDNTSGVFEELYVYNLQDDRTTTDKGYFEISLSGDVNSSKPILFKVYNQDDEVISDTLTIDNLYRNKLYFKNKKDDVSIILKFSNTNTLDDQYLKRLEIVFSC